jgi:hypothetical protein
MEMRIRRNKIDEEVETIGERELKNIDVLVRENIMNMRV